MSEKLNINPKEAVSNDDTASKWDNLVNRNPGEVVNDVTAAKWEDLAIEVPFGNGEINKEAANREEYLNALVDISQGMKAEDNIGENSIDLVIKMTGNDAAKYESHAKEMQLAAKIIDAEMIRRKAEDAYYDLAFKAAESPEDSEDKAKYLSARDDAGRRMQAAYVLAKEELHKAFPDLDEREASKRFFGYESWAFNPSELSRAASGKNDGKVYDANHNEISSERRPNNPTRVEMINKIIEYRSNMHGPAYSTNINDEVGVFRPGHI